MKIRKFKTVADATKLGLLKVGVTVETNGDLNERAEEKIIKGIIGEINSKSFFIWQNQKNRDGAKGKLSPISKGYVNSWKVCLNNSEAWIKIFKRK